jgi:hypothetical protein
MAKEIDVEVSIQFDSTNNTINLNTGDKRKWETPE